jgi:hypothetical protein
MIMFLFASSNEMLSSADQQMYDGKDLYLTNRQGVVND